MLSNLNIKKYLYLLFLAVGLICSTGSRANTHERAIPYIDHKKAISGEHSGNTVHPGEDDLLLQISHNHRMLLCLSLTFTVCCSLLVYFLVKAKHKRERFMEGYLTEIRIAKKVHDEIANEIYGTINYLISEKELTNEARKQLISKLDDIYLLTKNISRETNNIETGYDYPEHLKLMLTGYAGDTINVIIKGMAEINWNNVNPIKKIATYRSLQELMVNMKKHSGATLVIIDFSLHGKKLEITYTDNGCGATKEQLFSKSGLLNIENRMNSIDGQAIIEEEAEKGFHVMLHYPAYTAY
ncbi:sensor histidine kinase [Flavobacterium hauense]